ncbi:MAG: hypothetical protein AB7F64_00610 [Gammaproteobacteria bacterium]
MSTAQQITFDLLRKLELTNIVGNPGSTEETFLSNLPDDFNFIMSLKDYRCLHMKLIKVKILC